VTMERIQTNTTCFRTAIILDDGSCCSSFCVLMEVVAVGLSGLLDPFALRLRLEGCVVMIAV